MSSWLVRARRASLWSSAYICTARLIWRTWLMQTVLWATCLARLSAGRVKAASIAMMAMTTRSSIKVKPRFITADSDSGKTRGERGSGIRTRQGDCRKAQCRQLAACSWREGQTDDGDQEHHKIKMQNKGPVRAKGLGMAARKEILSDQAVESRSDISGPISRSFTLEKKHEKPDHAQEQSDEPTGHNRTTGRFCGGE